MKCPECGENLSKPRNVPTVIVTVEHRYVVPGGVVGEEKGAPVLYTQNANESNMVNTRMISIECNYCHKDIFKDVCK